MFVIICKTSLSFISKAKEFNHDECRSNVFIHDRQSNNARQGYGANGEKNEAKIQEMKEVIAEFVSHGPQGKIEVRCTPALTSGPPKQQSLMSEYKQSNGQIPNSQSSSIPQSCQASNEERITGPQIKLLRGTLKKHRISEREFCRQHQVDSIEAMPKHDAQWIIKDLIAEENKQ